MIVITFANFAKQFFWGYGNNQQKPNRLFLQESGF